MIEVDRASVAAGNDVLLSPVSARVQSAEALVVRGENGSGKSTLLRLLAGALKPSAGSVRIAGAPPEERDAGFRRRVAVSIGLPPFAADLTVFEHVLLVASTWQAEAQSAEASASEILVDLGLGQLERRFPHELSSGQTQLLGLALALVRPFDVLILDEPEQRLDPDRLELVIDVLRARRDDGAALVIATHSSRLADELGTCTVVLLAAA